MLERLTTEIEGVTEMRRLSKVVRSRAGVILGSAGVAMLLLPAKAFAGGFAAPSRVHHQAATGGSEGLAIFLGIIAVAALSVLILSRVGTERNGRQRTAESIRRKLAGAAS